MHHEKPHKIEFLMTNNSSSNYSVCIYVSYLQMYVHIYRRICKGLSDHFVEINAFHTTYNCYNVFCRIE